MTIERPDPYSIDGNAIVRAAAVGLAAGVIASFAMDRFQAAVAKMSSSDGSEPATNKVAGRVTKLVTGHTLAASARPIGGHVVHYTLGAALGVLYAVGAESRRDVTAGYGAAFGVGVAVILDNAAVPAVGLGTPPWKTSMRTHAYSLASHLVFGCAMETVRSGLGDATGVTRSGSIERSAPFGAAAQPPADRIDA